MVFHYLINFFFSFFHNNEDTRFTIFYSVVILCFISGTYWGLSLRLEEKKGDEFSYILALITLFPFSLAFLSLTAPTPANVPYICLSNSLRSVISKKV